MSDGDLDMPPTAQADPMSFGRFLFRLVLFAWSALLLIAAIAALSAFLVYDHVTQPRTPGPERSFTVPNGATGRDVGRLLAEQGFLDYEGFFRIALKLHPGDTVIRHGVYELPQGISARQILARLTEPPDHPLDYDAHRITVPEGLTIAQMAENFPDPEAFKSAAANLALIQRLGIEAETLEGFLMPNTYFFDHAPTEAEVVERMVAQFEKEYAALEAEVPGASGYDKLTIVTIASLVEEEARVEEERALVATVIMNRVERGMPLQLDATLQFALGKYGQRMLDADKAVDSPYNTYRNAGLPPGPISNPGVSSLRAALQPADADYLYFVSNADGKTHTFSSTLAEHNRARARFDREIAVQRRALEQGAQ